MIQLTWPAGICPTPLRIVALFLLLAVALAGCTSGGRGVSTQAGLAAIFNDARNHPESRADAQLQCAVVMNSGRPDPTFAAMVSGLLDVPQEQALDAYCAAMVEASIANEMTEADLRQLQTPREIRGSGPFGAMLRKAIAAHERLKSRQTAVPTSPRSAAAQS